MDATEIMKQIVQTQQNLRAQEDAKKELECQLAVVNQSILTDIQTLGQLQDQLDKAIHSASVHAAEDDDSDN